MDTTVVGGVIPSQPKPDEAEKLADPESVAFVVRRINFFVKDYKQKRDKSRDMSN